MPEVPTPTTVNHPRAVERVIAGRPTTDGAGVRLTRVLTQDLQRRLDPFLMLDAFCSDDPDDYIAGFPDHPHRGFETITYMIAGRLRHRDSAGHEGLLENGGVQWMTAGRGVIHSELPEQEDGLMEGFQLWLNLPRAEKLCTPWYRDFTAAELPRFTAPGGARVTVIAGASHGIEGAVTRPRTCPLYLDVDLPAGAAFEQPLAPAHNAFVYVYRGTLAIAGQEVPLGRMALLANAPGTDGLHCRAVSAARALVVAGCPLGEPIAQYGPFVMTNEQELRQAIEDFRAGRLA